MSERLTADQLDEIRRLFPTHFGVPHSSVLVQRAVTELIERRAADLTGEDDRKAVRWLSDLAEWTHCQYGRDVQLRALAVLDRLLGGGGR